VTEATQIRYIQRLKTLISSQLQWGTSDQWSNYDFEKLADAVAERTGVTLSVSTLKRIFGRVSYQSAPSLTTLNTLARFVGFEDWRAFTNTEESAAETTVPHDAVTIDPKPSKRKHLHVFRIVAPTIAVILLGLVIVNFGVNSRPHSYNPSDFSFRSKTILTEGLPNSVIFDYDAIQYSLHKPGM
jgi:hypothetical protein